MTIKVIREGRLPEEDHFAGTCGRCWTAIQCLPADGDTQEGDYRDQLDTGRLDVRYPTCDDLIHAYPWKSSHTQCG